MRHIPEDELHAYLDQGLSRSQCVEIESHLAGCPSCRATRDGIAALRDRTTALLAKLAPPRRIPPAFETLRGLAASRVSSRRRRVRAAVWAASLLGALGLGWTGSTILGPARSSTVATSTPRPTAEASAAVMRSDSQSVKPPAPVAEEPRRDIAATRGRIATAKVASRNVGASNVGADNLGARKAGSEAATRAAARKAREDSIRSARLAILDPTPVVELEPLEPSGAAMGRQFEGLWRTVSWDGAQSEVGQNLPHIDGLPVLQVQVQANDQGQRPLMVVAQQLSSGQVIQTIEGPAADVSQLLSRRTTTSTGSGLSVTVTDTDPADDQAMAMQMGDRMIAITGALPSDSLRAMIRRINAEMRSK
jgi:Putative zinc-finger